jgi:[NiFe] hydrogenase diaphorase moiety large subunit
MQLLCKKLWLEPGRVSEDGLVSVDATSCTGMCDQGPAALVNYRAITRMTPERVDKMAKLIQKQVPVDAWPADWFAVQDNVRRADILLNNAMPAGRALAAALATDKAAKMARGSSAVIEEIKKSNLRGRGGAGFTTGSKWESCRNAPADERFVICNGDEGEPGTFKDRVLLTRQADLVFEGMTIAGYAIGAKKGLLYLRGEYRYLLDTLDKILVQRRKMHLLGARILGQAGFDFDIEIHLGAGAYVCGEESALIESLEGKRGIPRNRPPYPVTTGFLNKPTIVNNIETFAAAALIVANSGDWYRGIGTARSTGTKLLSVSGDVARPGIYEYPFGITVAQVLVDAGAEDTQAVQISGPSGICIADDEFQRKIAFEDLPTAGAFMVFDHSRDMFAVAQNFAQFFAHESCGFCTPCRVGTSLLRNLLDKVGRGHGTQYDIEEISRISRLLQTATHCGLGHAAPNPILDTLKKFRPAWQRRLENLDFAPAFDLDGALAQARQMTGRDDQAAHLASIE